MATSSEFERLLSCVVYDAGLSVVEGLDPFRRLLEQEPNGAVLRFLNRAMKRLEGKRRSGIAFVLAEHYRLTGDLRNVRRLFEIDDPEVTESVLDALWGEPGSNPRMGPGIVELAIRAADHPAPGVRVEACFVFQNQCAWGVDVADAIAPLRALLDDVARDVRRQAAYAVGNLVKRRYDMSQAIPGLRRNSRHADLQVREASAWALWQLTRHKHNIGAAVPELVQMLTDDDDWAGARRNAVGALLHHARKSADNGRDVDRRVQHVRLDLNRKELKRFVEQLATGMG